MTALLQAELLKLRTTRTFLALTAVAVGTSLLIGVLVSLLSEPTQESVLTDVFTADTSGLFIVLLAIVGITGEWRHRTITSSLLAAPDRLRFLAAKTLAFAAAGLVLSLVVEPTVLALAPDVGRFAPFSALSGAIQGIPSEDIGAEDANLLSPGLAALAMLAWIGAVFAAGAVLLRRRDLN